MNLIERYALSCGLKIGTPEIYEKYFPLPIEKYITIHPYSKPAKTYDYWQDVVDDIAPTLQKAGYKIVQLGAKGEDKLNQCINIQGMTNLGQVGHIIKHSSLHVSVDSFTAHIAGSYNIPLVTLFSTSHVKNCCAYWGDKSKQVFLEPERAEGANPSFSYEEYPKSINKIKSEVVSANILRLLGLDDGKVKYHTVFIGNKYKNGVYFHSLVPHKNLQGSLSQNEGAEIRMDIIHDEDFLAAQLSAAKSSIITKNPISIDLLKRFKEKIISLFLVVEDTDKSKEFLSNALSIGIPCEIITFSQNESEIRALKLRFYEFKKLEVISPSVTEEFPDGLLFKSNKIYTCAGKTFYSLIKEQDRIHGQSVLSPNGYIPLELSKIDKNDLDFVKVIRKVS